jgi:F0F1-type ATP synthase assembly protein I
VDEGTEEGSEEGRAVKGFLRLFMNYGLVAAVVVWAAVVGMMAYRLDESPWRWAFVALVFVGLGTIAGIFWIRKYVDRQTKASEQGSKS